MRYILEKYDEGGVSHDAIIELTRLVLKHNCIEFDDDFFQQIWGTMMGTKLGVEYAVTFEEYLWDKFKKSKKYKGKFPELLMRFIDDNFGATTMSKDELLYFIKSVDEFHEDIKYTFKVGKSVEMLDTILEVKDGRIVPRIFYKETDSHSYLTYTSDHPPRCKDSIPYSQLLRLRRICKEDQVFEEESSRMIGFFTERGYPKSLAEKALTKVRPKKRADLIKDRPKEKSNKLTFPLTYNRFNKSIARIAQKHFHILSDDLEVGGAFTRRPTIAWRRSQNIRDQLVRARLRRKPREVVGTFPCGGAPKCKCCGHTCNDSLIVGPTGTFTVTQKFNCKAQNVLYAITCLKCPGIYVGQTTKNLHTRFGQHRRSAEQWHKPRYRDLPVAIHFGPDESDFNKCSVDDMRVSALYHLPDQEKLKSEEERMIITLGSWKPPGMNIEFNYMDLVGNDNI